MRNVQYPSYLALLESGELEKRIDKSMRLLSHCTLCPRECEVDRAKGELGECQTSSTARIRPTTVKNTLFVVAEDQVLYSFQDVICIVSSVRMPILARKITVRWYPQKK